MAQPILAVLRSQHTSLPILEAQQATNNAQALGDRNQNRLIRRSERPSSRRPTRQSSPLKSFISNAYKKRGGD